MESRAARRAVFDGGAASIPRLEVRGLGFAGLVGPIPAQTPLLGDGGGVAKCRGRSQTLCGCAAVGGGV